MCVLGSSFQTVLLLKQMYRVSNCLSSIFCYLLFSCKFWILFFNRSSPSPRWDTDVLPGFSKWTHVKLNSYLCHISLVFSKEHNGSILKNRHIQVKEIISKYLVALQLICGLLNAVIFTDKPTTLLFENLDCTILQLPKDELTWGFWRSHVTCFFIYFFIHSPFLLLVYNMLINEQCKFWTCLVQALTSTAQFLSLPSSPSWCIIGRNN